MGHRLEDEWAPTFSQSESRGTKMSNRAIIQALLVVGLGIAAAGCELYQDVRNYNQNLLGGGEPEKETAEPKKETIVPKTEAVRPKAEAAKPARDPFVTTGDTFGEKELMRGRLSISVVGKYLSRVRNLSSASMPVCFRAPFTLERSH